LLATAAILPIGGSPGAGNPLGAQVVGGSATVQGQGTSSVTVTQSTGNAIINWQSFNISSGEQVSFSQPNASSVALNRVTGVPSPSMISGTLTANGHVFLVNPEGILFGAGAVIDTAGFLATTSDIGNGDFMAGKYRFDIHGRPDASIVNYGTITATRGGFAALVAPGVRNSGTITATLGSVSLVAGNRFTLDFYGDRLISLAVGSHIASTVMDVATGRPLSSLVSNDGKLSANGGRVELTAAAARRVVDSVINNTGVIEANSIGRHNGQIVLSAAQGASGLPKQTIKLSGTISAAGRKSGQRGGSIQVTGQNIEVKHASLDASGSAGGGTVLIGAGPQGTALPQAATVVIGAATRIDADATGAGNGGQIVVASDGRTAVHGTMMAQGGPAGGNGGSVQTSGRTVDFSGLRVDTLASRGASGTWLVDATRLTVGAAAARTITGDLATTNVTLQTDPDRPAGDHSRENRGDIIVAAPIAWSSANTLTLSALRDVTVRGGVTIVNTGAGNLVLRADNTGTGRGSVNLGTEFGSVDFSRSSGTVSIYYDPRGESKYETPRTYGADAVVINPSVPNQLTAYMLINNVDDLRLMGSNSRTLAGTYALGADIDAASFRGFGIGSTFTGLLDGNGGLGRDYTISNLKLSSSASPVGLFGFIGATGTVRNLDLRNVSATATGGPTLIGTLAGENDGTISNVTVSGTVHGGKSLSGSLVGGLVGQNDGTITLSSAAVNVSVGNANGPDNIAGGLAGKNVGTISQSHASGTITGGSNSMVGGLVGQNVAIITGSSATGAVRGVDDVGGLVGQNVGSIDLSSASGRVAGGDDGGLVGANLFGTISRSDATGEVIARGSSAGGLVGFNQGLITQSYATGNVSGPTAGALIGVKAVVADDGGLSQPTIAQSNATGNVSGQWAGGPVAKNSGTIFQSDATGDVRGGPDSIVSGGLVGINYSAITQSYATGNVSGWMAGGLAGVNQGLITQSYATGSVSGQIAGGLVGLSTFGSPSAVSISQSFATGPVNGTVVSGGLVGINYSAITLSYATGNVSGPTAGALIGVNAVVADDGGLSQPTIAQSNATGNVSGQWAGGLVANNSGTIFQSDASIVSGGLVGINYSAITQSYATGNVSGWTAGGLVGVNQGLITQSYATGSVSGEIAGGLVGLSTFGSPSAVSISQSFATGSVNGTVVSGGLVGINYSAITQSYATGNVSGPTAGGPIGVNAVVADDGGPSQPTIAQSNATGNVSGQWAGGLVANNSGTTLQSDASTVSGGLVGNNYSAITQSYATGNVSGWTAGGQVGVNAVVADGGGLAQPTIAQSSATGNVGGQWAGGLVANNSGTIFQSDAGIVSGVLAGINYSAITQSYATGNVSGPTAGGLVGVNQGLITQSYATGSVSGQIAGGLVGFSTFGSPSAVSISQSFATGLVNGTVVSGGLVGINYSAITQSYATGNVTGPTAGGLVGVNQGVITQSDATGSVSGEIAGGLVGLSTLGFPSLVLISQSFATGPVDGIVVSGGLVGINYSAITQSYATGNVSGPTAGGLVGINAIVADGDGLSQPTIAQSYATGNVSGQWAGGLVANSSGTIFQSYAAGDVRGGPDSIAGGLVAVNFGAIEQAFASGAVTSGDGGLAGGLVGLNGSASIPVSAEGPLQTAPATGAISNAYATGAVTGGANGTFGGLVGQNGGSIDWTYATGVVAAGPGSMTGGLVAAQQRGSGSGGQAADLLGRPLVLADATGAVMNSYWDTESTRQTASIGGSGLTTAQLTAALPSSFDPSIWTISQGQSFPQLWFAANAPAPQAQAQPGTTPITAQAQFVTRFPSQDSRTTPTAINLPLAPTGTGPSGTSGRNLAGRTPAGLPPPGVPQPGVPQPPGIGDPNFSGVPPLNETRFVADEVMVQFGAGLSADQLQATARRLGLSVATSENLPLVGRTLVRLRITNRQSVRDVIQALEAARLPVIATPNYQFAFAQDAAEPAESTSSPSPASPIQYVVDKLHLAQAHRLSKGDGVLIAMIDSAVDAEHPDLQGTVVERFDDPGTDAHADPHGTGMAGAIASHQQLLGVAPGAKLLTVRAFAPGTTDRVLKGLDWAIRKGARIINMSFAGPFDPMLQEVLKRARAKDVLLVAAAGNAGPTSPPVYPGADPNVIAVTATDGDDKLFSRANRGRYVAVAAPGVDILVPAPDAAYQLTTGTSVAAAHVSGVAALMMARNPKASVDTIREILLSTAKDLGPKGRDDQFGWGLVDPIKALTTLDTKVVAVQ